MKRLTEEDDGGFVYRGQTRLYDLRSLTPAVFRNPSFGAVFHAIGLNFAASSYLLGAAPALNGDYRLLAPELHMESPTPEILSQALAQHYDYKSNLIDVTYDLRVAASFATTECTARQSAKEGAIFRWRAQSLFPLLHDLRQIRSVLNATSFPSLTTHNCLRPEVQQAGGIWVPWNFNYQGFRYRDDYMLCAEIFPFFKGTARCLELPTTDELFPNTRDPVYGFFYDWSQNDVSPLSLASWKLFSLLRARAGGEFTPGDLGWLLRLGTDDEGAIIEGNKC